jgi:ubiquinone/menaquinone biosynthesis C-methylase UbiE
MKISNYDQFDYDYSKYWKNRNYEHVSEVHALSKLMNDMKGKWFMDLGGSYGRHLPNYYSKYENPIIVDYSLNTLINNKERIWKSYPNTKLVAANAYYLPFRDSVFDGSTMVRVLHHIENTDQFFTELVRVLKDKSTHIQEFANKMHIKARITHLLKMDKAFFSTEPYQQPTHNNFEGSNGIESVFLNFHPTYLKKMLKEKGFRLLTKQGVSYLRLGILKKIFPSILLFNLEKLMQKMFGRTHISPSIFYKLSLKKDSKSKDYEAFEDILVCPKCKTDLKFRNEECVCTQCKNRYEKVAGVWDFRVQ